MGDENSEHLALIRRWLAGETVNNTVGIKIVGGPFHGRTKIVQLDQSGLPPTGFRGRPGRTPGPWNPAAKHIYLSVRAPDTPAGWAYEYTGTDTATVPDTRSAATGAPQQLDQRDRGTPQQSAGILRALASFDGVEYHGGVRDRSGRAGMAFSVDSDFGGLPKKQTAIFDPDTGKLLAYEEMLTEDAGELNVRIPSVTGYTTHLSSGYSN